MLTGTGKYLSTQAQIWLPMKVFKEVSKIAMEAWRSLSHTGKATSAFLSNIKQGATESFEDFVARLQETASRALANPEAEEIVVKQLAFENANTTCQALLRHIRKEGSIGDYIKMCMDASPAHIQGFAMAAALQGQTYSKFMQSLNKSNNTKRDNAKKGFCFTCGKSGHFSRECPLKGNNQEEPNKPKPKSICPRCNKGYHWAKECRSKYHKDGSPISQDTSSEIPKNGSMGLPQPQRNQWGTPSWEPRTLQSFPCQTWPAAPQGAQG